MGLGAAAAAIAATAVAASSAVAATTFSIGLALEVTAAVGATLSAVGSIAKIPGLQKAGMVIGAIGAVGSVASAAGLIDGSTALFGSATPATDAAVADAQAAGTVSTMAGDAEALPEPPMPPGNVGAVDPATGEVITAPSAAGVAPPSTESPMVLSSTSEPATGAATPAAGQTSTTAGTTASTPDTGTGTGTTPATGTGTGTGATSTAPGTPAPGATPASVATPTTPPSTEPGLPEPPQAAGNLGAIDPKTGQIITKAVDAKGDIITMPDSQSGMLGMLGSLKDWAQKNPMLAYGMAQAGGSLITGAFSSLTPAQAAQANAQANLNNAQAAQVKTQTAAMTQPKAAATLAPVTGAPAPLVPGYGGNRQLAANQVTGMPASFGLINQAPQIGAA